MRFTSYELARIARAKCDKDALVTNVTFDSRCVESGSLFVAVKGKNSDGHDYVKKAVEAGASAILVDKAHATQIRKEVKGCSVIEADSPLEALRTFASVKAKESGANIIGITGSCGKTTTKEMLYSILSVSHKSKKTMGNLNSEYGLPLSLLQLEKGDEFGVFEIGVDHIGEMERQAETLRPDEVIITNIGMSHLEAFGSSEMIAREKGMLIGAETASFAPASCLYNDYFASRTSYFNAVPSLFESVRELGLSGWLVKLYGKKFVLPSIGRHSLADASLATSLSEYLGIDQCDIIEGLSNYRPVFGRSRIVKEGKVTVIEDCYNAAYDSAKDAIETIGRIKWNGSKRIVLGDMKELGEKSEIAHREIGRLLTLTPCDNIYLYGEEMENAYKAILDSKCDKNIVYTTDFEQLSEKVRKDTRAGDLMLLKGSRAMAMERLCPLLREVV